METLADSHETEPFIRANIIYSVVALGADKRRVQIGYDNSGTLLVTSSKNAFSSDAQRSLNGFEQSGQAVRELEAEELVPVELVSVGRVIDREDHGDAKSKDTFELEINEDGQYRTIPIDEATLIESLASTLQFPFSDDRNPSVVRQLLVQQPQNYFAPIIPYCDDNGLQDKNKAMAIITTSKFRNQSNLDQLIARLYIPVLRNLFTTDLLQGTTQKKGYTDAILNHIDRYQNGQMKVMERLIRLSNASTVMHQLTNRQYSQLEAIQLFDQAIMGTEKSRRLYQSLLTSLKTCSDAVFATEATGRDRTVAQMSATQTRKFGGNIEAVNLSSYVTDERLEKWRQMGCDAIYIPSLIETNFRNYNNIDYYLGILLAKYPNWKLLESLDAKNSPDQCLNLPRGYYEYLNSGQIKMPDQGYWLVTETNGAVYGEQTPFWSHIMDERRQRYSWANLKKLSAETQFALLAHLDLVSKAVVRLPTLYEQNIILNTLGWPNIKYTSQEWSSDEYQGSRQALAFAMNTDSFNRGHISNHGYEQGDRLFRLVARL